MEWEWGEYSGQCVLIAESDLTKRKYLSVFVDEGESLTVYPDEVDSLIRALQEARDTIRREASRKEAEDVVERARRLV